MAVPQGQVAQQFIGSWSLVSWTATQTDGTVRHPYGERPVGRIMYQSGGQMVACLMRRERTAFASVNRHAATQEERDAAYREFVSYFGSFTVDEAAGTVSHHVDGATFPNWIGTDLVRTYRFAEDTLALGLVGLDGAAHELLWKRLSNENR